MGKTLQYKLKIDAGKSLNTLQDLEQHVADLREEISQVDVGSKQFKELQTELVLTDSKLKNVNKTIEGMDYEKVSGEIGKLAGGIGAVTAAFTMLGGEGNETMEELQEKLNKSLAIFMAVKGAIEGITTVIKLWQVAQAALNAIMSANPLGLIIAGVAALSAGIVVLISHLKEQSKMYREIANIKGGYLANLEIEKQSMNDLFEQIKKTNAGSEERKILVDELNRNYKDYLPNLDLEKATIQELVIAQKASNVELQNKIAIQAQDKATSEIITKMTDLKIKEMEATQKLARAEKDRDDAMKAGGESQLSYIQLYDKAKKELDAITFSLQAQEQQLKNVQEYFRGQIIDTSDIDELVGDPNDDESGTIGGFTKKTRNLEGAIEIVEDKISNLREEIKRAPEKELPFLGIELEVLEKELKRLQDLVALYTEKSKKAVEERVSAFTKEEEVILASWVAIHQNYLLEEQIIDANLEGQEKVMAQMELKLDLLKNQYEHIKKLYVADGELTEEELKNLKKVQEEMDKLKEKIDEMNKPDKPGKSWLAEELGVSDTEAKKIFDAAFDIASKISNAILKIKQNQLQQQYEMEKEAMSAQQEREIEAVADSEDRAKQEELIREKFAAKQREIDKKLEEDKKRMAKSEVAINTAIGVAKIWAEYAAIPAVGAVVAAAQSAVLAAAMAAQLAIIDSQKFAKGGILDGPSHADGGIMTMFGELEGGEAVINKQATARFAPVLSAINQSTGGNAIGGSGAQLIDYDLLASKINDKKVYVVSSDITEQQGIDTKIEDRATI